MNSMDLTPDSKGMARWARKVLAEAPEGCNDANTARKVLAELEPPPGVEPD
ncbi:hypothetical protein [Mycobacteroides abscessus]|uniref:hypothetical protein n=1 Tax=Mycobacteroides abscessus TaxID=36809 RepID=UPI0013F5A9BD|nr:hypothetical protein [Mycobacteroides abscessus]